MDGPLGKSLKLLGYQGHTITFLLPAKVQKDLQHSNLHPNFITLHHLTIPHVNGLPHGAANASEISLSLHHLLGVESLMSDCQIVLVPQLGDQILNTRLMAEELKVGVEVEREENGWLSKENLRKAIKSVMEEESEVGNLVRQNHAKWKDSLMNPGFMNAYFDKFAKAIQELVDK
ncbi:UDP-glycosyltransferase 79B9-like [Mangifera indica]|uniref:UDP-glycosyltransferase 79B9-like n=1 Tax=Mangifera indica TaxID=29780 RepID=UPI001CFA32AA|nr:UDP-glycosyltransferase 79B9-like [Mangifera indica]